MGLVEWHWQQVGSEIVQVSRNLWVTVNMGTSRGLILFIQFHRASPEFLAEARIPGTEWLWGPQ